MIDITNRHIVRARKQIPIVKWEIWFHTPFGITPDIEEAINRVVEKGGDPEINVIPIPVAIGSDGTTEVFFVRQ